MIDVEDVSFTYSKSAAPAIAGLNFAVERGEIFGFLGPSGAGKSTTQKILIGSLKGYGGRVVVSGKDRFAWKSDYFERVGVCFELPNHFMKLTAQENLAYFVLGLSQLRLKGARQALAWLAPAMVLQNLAITGFYFAGGLMLLEKAEGSLEAQIVTPLRAGEHLASKVATLTALAVVYNLAVVFLLVGYGFAALPLAAGVILAAALFVLAGCAAAARYESVNTYLLPSTLYLVPLLLPMLYAAGWESALLYLHPIQPALVVMRAAFEPVAAWELIYGALYGGLWVGVAFFVCRRVFVRFVAER
jgi:hypothetical protein